MDRNGTVKQLYGIGLRFASIKMRQNNLIEYQKRRAQKQSGTQWTTEDLKRAEMLGRNAYHKNINALCHDEKMMNMLEGTELGDGIKPMKAWVEGWTQEHLRAPLEATVLRGNHAGI